MDNRTTKCEKAKQTTQTSLSALQSVRCVDADQLVFLLTAANLSRHSGRDCKANLIFQNLANILRIFLRT